MFLESLHRHIPHVWSSLGHWEDCREVEISPWSSEYNTLARPLQMGTFNKGISRITRVENPFLYGHFLLKRAEYESRGGGVQLKELYHCTAASKVASIIKTNLDWRLARRVKFGRGVSFSPSPSYANQEASRDNGLNRAMIVADVLVGKIQPVCSSCTLPITGYDTTSGNNSQVYVKFYDNEFYPKFVIYYESNDISYGRRLRLW